jgi:hypothetical protein
MISALAGFRGSATIIERGLTRREYLRKSCWRGVDQAVYHFAIVFPKVDPAIVTTDETLAISIPDSTALGHIPSLVITCGVELNESATESASPDLVSRCAA